MVTSSLIMAMWISVILAPLMTMLYSVILIVLHLLAVLILEETGLHQMGLEYMRIMFQDLPETEVLW